jgi:high-affinity iron transporter
MLSSLLITLREGLEAALIVGIILAYLNRSGNRRAHRSVWLGTVLAVAASIIAGAIIFFAAGELSGRAEEVFEGTAVLIAAGVLTWVVFWMRRQAANIRNHLDAQLDSTLTSRSSLGLVTLCFVAVVREGIETVVFLFATTRVDESPTLSALGGFLGLVLAVILGYSVYKGASKLNLRAFFSTTSLLLIFVAAGLLAHGIHELHEAGIIPAVVEHVWDTTHIVPEGSTFGRFLTAILGYNANPSLVEVVAYFGYLGLALAGYFYPSALTRGERIPKRMRAEGR